MALANLLGGFVVILVGVTLMPEVGDQVYNAQYDLNVTSGLMVDDTNVSGTVDTLLDLVVLFFALGVMATGVALAVNGLRQSGMM